MRELLYVPFYIVYLLDWVFHGFKYRRITFEQEAYAHEDNPEYLEYETLRAMEEMIYIYWDDFPSVVTE